MSRERSWLRWLTAVLVLGWIGCRAAPPTPEPPFPLLVGEAEEIVWPPPPDPARIRYVGSFGSSREIGIRRSLLRRLGDFVFGRSDDSLVRPTGIAARGTSIAIADPGGQALVLIEWRLRRLLRITRGGGENLVSPVGVALGAEAVVYLTDSHLGRVFVYDSEGQELRHWGEGTLHRPTAITVDTPRQRVYVTDAMAHRIAVFDLEGRLLTTIGGRGTDEGLFNWPGYLTVDAEGNLYVVDSLNFRVEVFSPDGQFRWKFGHPGDTAGDFSRPKGIAVDRESRIYVVDALFDSVQIFDGGGAFLLGFGGRGVGKGEFWLPTGLAIDDGNRIYVADSYNRRIQLFELVRD